MFFRVLGFGLQKFDLGLLICIFVLIWFEGVYCLDAK